MRSDKAPSGMTSRQKITIAIFVIVFVVVVWQVIGMFRSSEGEPSATAAPANRAMSGNRPMNAANQPANAGAAPSNQPKQGQLMATPNTQANSPELIAARAQQQELQAKYIAAINELQMLKIQRDIAQANQAIMAAKLATVTAQKSIINLVNPPAPIVPAGVYTTALGGTPGGSPSRPLGTPPRPGSPNAPSSGPSTDDATKDITYRVISVSQIQYRWSAVLGYQGSLYHVQVGDVIPADGSTVISISRGGVVISKSGVRKKLSLVPII